jgi:hypothetical protein
MFCRMQRPLYSLWAGHHRFLLNGRIIRGPQVILAPPPTPSPPNRYRRLRTRHV